MERFQKKGLLYLQPFLFTVPDRKVFTCLVPWLSCAHLHCLLLSVFRLFYFILLIREQRKRSPVTVLFVLILFRYFVRLFVSVSQGICRGGVHLYLPSTV